MNTFFGTAVVPMRATIRLGVLILLGWVFLWLEGAARASTTGVEDVPATGETASRAASIGFDPFIDPDSGLHGETAWWLARDRQGYLWIATRKGLDRFDGHRLRHFEPDPEDPGSLPASASEMLVTGDGTLWVATWGGGIVRFDPATESFVAYPVDPKRRDALQDGRAQTLLETRDGTIWIGTAGSGIARLDPETHSIENLQFDSEGAAILPHGRVWDLLEAEDGKVWVATNAGIAIVDPQSARVVSLLFDEARASELGGGSVRALHRGPEDRLFIGTEKGLLHAEAHGAGDGDAEIRAGWPHGPDDQPQPEGGVYVFFEHGETLWVGAEKALYSWNRRTGSATVHPLSRNGGSSVAWSILDDGAGRLLVGTHRRGVLRIDPRGDFPEIVDLGPGFEDSDVKGISRDPSGGLYLATQLGAFHRPAGGGEIRAIRPTDPELASRLDQGLFDIWVAADGAVWMATLGRGLFRYRPSEKAWDHFEATPDDPSTPTSDRINCLYESSGGRVLIGSMDGLDRFDPSTGRFEAFEHDPEDTRTLSDSAVKALLEDRRGILWVGTFEGLDRLAPGSGRFERFAGPRVSEPSAVESGRRQALPSPRITALAETPDGTVWAGTRGGLASIDREDRIRVLGGEDPLLEMHVLGLEADADGFLWVSSEHGLSRIDPRQGRVRRVHGRAFPSRYSGHSSRRSADGMLFFGHEGRVEIVDPEIAFERFGQDARPRLAFGEARLREGRAEPERLGLAGPIDRSEGIELDWQDNALDLDFALLDFEDPSLHRYAYRLDPRDRAWTHTDAERPFAHYPFLAPGRYVLRVKGSSASGAWTEERALEVRVRPAAWRSGPALSAYALTFGLLVWGVARAQRRRLEEARALAAHERAVSQRLLELDGLKDQFLANTSHELRTPLFGMIGLAEALLDEGGDLSMDARAKLEALVGGGYRLSSLVNDILDVAKLKQEGIELRLDAVELGPLVDALLALSAPLAGKSGSEGLELVNAVDTDVPPVLADRVRLEQILHNLVGNAIKFTPEGRVEVVAKVRGDRVEIEVKDTGIGIPADKLEAIFAPFVQAEASIEREIGGTGLGLAITRQLVELHGSEIRLESEVGRGSAFRFDLPIATEDTVEKSPTEQILAVLEGQTASTGGADLLVPAVAGNGSRAPGMAPAREGGFTAEDSKAAGGGSRPATILVIDDEPLVRQVVEHHLGSEKYRVVCLAEGTDAGIVVEDEAVDLVLLDVMMPRLSGYEVCRSLRERRGPEELPILFLSAKNQTEDRVFGFDLGGNDYLLKPIARNELLARVRIHLDLLRSHRDQVEEAKILRGLLPICSNCKKIRDDDEQWLPLEVYIHDHSEAVFSHGMCPDCLSRVDLD